MILADQSMKKGATVDILLCGAGRITGCQGFFRSGFKTSKDLPSR
jgi:hypothetical protein